MRRLAALATACPIKVRHNDPQRLIPRRGMQMSRNRLANLYDAPPWEALGRAPLTTSENLFACHRGFRLSQDGHYIQAKSPTIGPIPSLLPDPLPSHFATIES